MYQCISIVKAKELIEQASATVVDIRDGQSFASGHIAGAIALDNDNVKQFLSMQNKQLPVLVCCYHGNSSKQAAAFLAEQGLEDVYSIDGGFEAWRLQYPFSTSE